MPLQRSGCREVLLQLICRHSVDFWCAGAGETVEEWVGRPVPLARDYTIVEGESALDAQRLGLRTDRDPDGAVLERGDADYMLSQSGIHQPLGLRRLV